MDDGDKRFHAVDAVLLIGAIGSLGAIAVVRVFVVPSFEAMFRDFGGVLPVITMAVMSGGMALGSMLLVALLAASGTGLVFRGYRPVGRIFLVASVIIAMMTIATMVIGLYLPIFQLAGAVKA